MSIGSAIEKAKQTYENLGIVASFFHFFQGRCTFFAIAFAIVGIIGWFKHLDLGPYSVFVGTIQALLVAHSYKEDHFEDKKYERDKKTPE